MSLPVAVQLYSVRDDAAKDLRATLEQIKSFGYDGVEFAGLYGYTPEEVRDLCQEIRLTPVSAHVPYYDMVADPRGVLSDYAKIGCRFIAIPYLTPECRPGTPGFDDVIKNARMLGETAASLGMSLLYHNHDFEFTKIDGQYALDKLYDSVPASLLQTELDTCWVSVGGEAPADYITKYSGRCPVVHLKDYAGQRGENMYELIGIKSDAKPSGEFEFRPVGSGVLDFEAITEAAVKAGTEWLIVEQDKPSMGLSALGSVKQSRKYLKSIGF